MKIEIRKRQETIDDVAKEPKYTVHITRLYGTEAFNRETTDTLYEFEEDEMRELARELSKRFLPTPHVQ